MDLPLVSSFLCYANQQDAEKCNFCHHCWKKFQEVNIKRYADPGDVLGIVFTFPENPEQNEQKIRESKEVVFHRPFWFRIFRVGFWE